MQTRAEEKPQVAPIANHWMNRIRRGALVVSGGAVAWALLGLPLFVFPVIDVPRKSDVIIVLGPPVQTRVNFALRLAESGFAERIVISVPKTGRSSATELAACTDSHPGFTVDCFTPRPFTTQGEARMLRTLAEPWGIDRAIIITNNPHITRARLLFTRCFAGDLYFLTDSSRLDVATWASQYVYQSAALVKAAVTPEC